MSHFTTVKTQIRDLVCLKLALKDLQFAFTEAQVGTKLHVRGYAHQQAEADMVIHISKSYDVGVKVDDQGGVHFIADWWGVETTRGLAEKEFLDKVTKRYSYHKVLQEIRKKGYNFVEETAEDKIHIKVTSWQ